MCTKSDERTWKMNEYAGIVVSYKNTLNIL
jgi:hypothetical protein